jgi:hypothetical protein
MNEFRAQIDVGAAGRGFAGRTDSGAAGGLNRSGAGDENGIGNVGRTSALWASSRPFRSTVPLVTLGTLPFGNPW